MGAYCRPSGPSGSPTSRADRPTDGEYTPCPDDGVASTKLVYDPVLVRAIAADLTANDAKNCHAVSGTAIVGRRARSTDRSTNCTALVPIVPSRARAARVHTTESCPEYADMQTTDQEVERMGSWLTWPVTDRSCEPAVVR